MEEEEDDGDTGVSGSENGSVGRWVGERMAWRKVERAGVLVAFARVGRSAWERMVGLAFSGSAIVRRR